MEEHQLVCQGRSVWKRAGSFLSPELSVGEEGESIALGSATQVTLWDPESHAEQVQESVLEGRGVLQVLTN